MDSSALLSQMRAEWAAIPCNTQMILDDAEILQETSHMPFLSLFQQVAKDTSCMPAKHLSALGEAARGKASAL